jgi:hypothetical protein
MLRILQTKLIHSYEMWEKDIAELMLVHMFNLYVEGVQRINGLSTR